MLCCQRLKILADPVAELGFQAGQSSGGEWLSATGTGKQGVGNPVIPGPMSLPPSTLKK